MGRTIAEVSEDTLRIQAFLEAQAPGAKLTYAEIEQATDVRMDDTGKDRMRTAAKRAHIEYACRPGIGIELASAQNGAELLAHRIGVIGDAVRRGNRCHKTITSRFISEMTPEDQQRFVYVGAVFGAILAATENGRRLYATPDPKLLAPGNIPIPGI